MSCYGSPNHYPSDLQDLTHGGAQRKRVGKACDRCRIKKSKCNGDNPCDRCNTDDQVCTYTERKRPRDKLPPRGYVDTLESRCQVLTQGLIELDRLRKNLPPSTTQFIAGRPSGKRANQILKEIGIDTTKIDSDLDDYEVCSNGSPGAESLGEGPNLSPYDDVYPRELLPFPPSRHRSPGSSCSTSVNAGSSHSWEPEGHARYHHSVVPQLMHEQSISPPNMTPNGDFVDHPIMMLGATSLISRGSEYHPPSPPATFEYRPAYSHSSQNLPEEYPPYYGYDPVQPGGMVPGMEHNHYFGVQSYA